ncbi:MAG: hypothetical protein N3A38_05275 [Planctomycetota bacterium]|nr:hypothetical protein [Planctomycetota bacterium]
MEEIAWSGKRLAPARPSRSGAPRGDEAPDRMTRAFAILAAFATAAALWLTFRAGGAEGEAADGGKAEAEAKAGAGTGAGTKVEAGTDGKAGTDARPPLAERLRKEAEEWKARMGDGYIVEALEPCFVLISNQPREKYEPVRDSTLLGFCRRFWTMYGCRRKPDEPLRVFLFAGADSYKRKSKELFGREPTTPFGYYSSANRALVMNISTGGGTLAHELTHALAGSDFPDIPAWFNEGLGSLYEQCRYDGESGLRGLVNWRLPALQKAVAAGSAPALKKLVHSSAGEFYGARVGLNYAEARYLCMFLQEKGVLARFYAAFRDRFAEDPSGEKFLLEALGEKDLAAVEKSFSEWVSGLKK